MYLEKSSKNISVIVEIWKGTQILEKNLKTHICEECEKTRLYICTSSEAPLKILNS